MSSEINYLLTCLSEECSEVIKAASKGIRFGLDSSHPDRGMSTNAEDVIQEFHDLWAVIELLQEQGALPKYSEDTQRFQKEAKKLKIYELKK